MRKILLIIGCVILAAGLLGLDYWQGSQVGLMSQQLKQDNTEIQQLKNEKSQLENQIGEVGQPENAVEESTGPEAVLCFGSLNQNFYNEIYSVVKEYVDSGILVLENGKLPGDYNYISTEEFSELIDNGWAYAISLERAADDSQWQANIENYLNTLSNRVSEKPTAYYLPSGSCSESDAQILKEFGFETVLCHEQSTADTVGELNIVQLFGYNDSSVADNISATEHNCGLEIWVSWNTSALTSVRYTETALQDLLNSGTITLKGLNDISDGESVSAAQTPEERIAEIDQQIDALYH